MEFFFGLANQAQALSAIPKKNYASRLALLPFQGKRSNASLG